MSMSFVNIFSTSNLVSSIWRLTHRFVRARLELFPIFNTDHEHNST